MKQVELKNSCDKVVEFNYLKHFVSTEIDEFKTQLSEKMIVVDEIETDLKEIKDEFRSKLEPLKNDIKILLTNIRDKAKRVKEECYVFYEGEFAVFYNSDGNEVYKRPLDASERQKTIFMETRTGTNN